MSLSYQVEAKNARTGGLSGRGPRVVLQNVLYGEDIVYASEACRVRNINGEFILIMVVALIVLGPKQLLETARLPARSIVNWLRWQQTFATVSTWTR